jgi:hypothetical protein
VFEIVQRGKMGCKQLKDGDGTYVRFGSSCPDGLEPRLPLYPQKRTQLGHPGKSEKCHKRSFLSSRACVILYLVAFPREAADLSGTLMSEDSRDRREPDDR